MSVAMDDCHRHYANWKELGFKKTTYIHSYDILEKGKL